MVKIHSPNGRLGRCPERSTAEPLAYSAHPVGEVMPCRVSMSSPSLRHRCRRKWLGVWHVMHCFHRQGTLCDNNLFGKSDRRQEGAVKSLDMWILLTVVLVAAPAVAQTAASAGSAAAPGELQTNWWSQAGGENGPERVVWAAQKTPETPYTGVNKPIWHLADILKSHHGQARWEEKVVLTRDFDGRYVQMAAGDKAKCMFYADDRVFGWVYSGAVRMTVDGQEPKVLSKGWAF